MKFSSSLSRAIIWSLLLSILIRILYGTHAVFGLPALLIPAILGIFAALLFTPGKNSSFIIISVIHIVATTSFTILLDFTGIMKSLANDSMIFFANYSNVDVSELNIFWSIFLVNVLYFGVYVISSGILCRVRSAPSSDLSEHDDAVNEDFFE